MINRPTRMRVRCCFEKFTLAKYKIAFTVAISHINIDINIGIGRKRRRKNLNSNNNEFKNLNSNFINNKFKQVVNVFKW